MPTGEKRSRPQREAVIPAKFDGYHVNIKLPNKAAKIDNPDENPDEPLPLPSINGDKDGLAVQLRSYDDRTPALSTDCEKSADIPPGPREILADDADEEMKAAQTSDCDIIRSRSSITAERDAVIESLFEKAPKKKRVGSNRFEGEEEEVSFDVATQVYWDVFMRITEGSLHEVMEVFPRVSSASADQTIQHFFIERAKHAVKSWRSDKADEYRNIYKASARSNHPERVSVRVFRFLWCTAESWTLRKTMLLTWPRWIPDINKNLVALRTISNSNPTWIRSLPFMSLLILRCTVLFINVTLRNEVFEQTGKGFSADYINETRKETIISLYNDDTRIDFIVTLVKDRLGKLREEYADKWEVSEELKNPHQEYFIAKRDTYVGDIESLCEKTTHLIKSINQIVPIAAMLDSDTRQKEEAKLSNEAPTPLENTRKQAMAVLKNIRTLNSRLRREGNGLDENAVRILDAMVNACKNETGTKSSVASIVRTEIFSFLKCIVMVDADLHQDIMRRYKIGTLGLRAPSGLMTYGWWDEGFGSTIQALVTPSIMISMLGGTNIGRFDHAFNLFLESIIVHRK